MSSRKRTFKNRWNNLLSWFKRPGFLITFAAFGGLMGAMFWLIAPCGRYDSPVNGVCGDGDPIASPLVSIMLCAAVAFVIFLAVGTGSANDSKLIGAMRIIGDIRGSLEKRPKWRKRWFPVMFVFSYVLFAGANYLFNIGGGLPAYIQVAQYTLLIPPFAAMFASWLLSGTRQHVRKPRQRKTKRKSTGTSDGPDAN